MVKRIVQNLLHKELSYQIHGAAIEVRKDFGPGHKEKLYQKALEEELKRRKIYFEREKAIRIYSPKDGKYIGLYRPDFIIDNKIIVEIKAERFVSQNEIKRIYDYLRNSRYELAYFVNFASPKLFVKRIIHTNNRKPLLKNLLVSISLILALFSGLSARAAEVNVIPLNWGVAVNQTLETNVSFSAGGESINAISGEVGFPQDILELKEIKDGNSIVNFWVEKPRQEGNKIIFAGVIPGGFNGENGLLFSLVFKTKKEGSGIIELRNMESFYNDGEGTPAPLKLFQLAFTVKKEGATVRSPRQKDSEPPESFAPEIAREDSVFDGKWFLVFATQDKRSGIDHYEIKETRNKALGKWLSRWRVAESPHVLKDQGLRSYIFVKAVDKAGNERIVTLSPQNPLKWYENYLMWVIIILGIIIIYFIKRILWKKLLTH